MQKYRCVVCDYIYDPEIGDPDSGIEQEHLLKTSRKTGSVRSAALTKQTLSRPDSRS